MYLKSLKFRLTTVFSLVFLIGTAALYVVTYFLLSSSLQLDEQKLLRAKLLEMWAIYQTGRSAAIRNELTLENYISESTAFFVRLADRDNHTIMLFHPASWRNYDIESLSKTMQTDEKTYGRLSTGGDGPVLTFASVKLFDGNYLQVGVSNGRRIELLSRLRRVYLLVAVPFVLLGVIGGWLAASRSLVPVKRLSAALRFIIDTGSLAERIPQTGSRDELDELIDHFNKMLARIEALVGGMRRSLDDVAHDLRTPLTRLRMRAEESLRNPEDTSMHLEAFSAIVAETEQILTILRTLMDISEAEAGVMRLDKEHIDLGELVSDIAELYSYTAAEKGIRLVTDISQTLEVFVDVDRVRQVFANLLDNAVKYTGDGGEIVVRGTAGGGLVRVEIEDTGIGIAEEDLPHIWERLFRADRSRRNPGVGLGLGIVKAIVEAHDGSVDVRSTVGKGSVFVVEFPGTVPET